MSVALTINDSMSRTIEAMREASEELDRRNELISRLIAAIEEIAEIAEDRYDGPEDTNWGPVLNICQKTLGIII